MSPVPSTHNDDIHDTESDSVNAVDTEGRRLFGRNSRVSFNGSRYLDSLVFDDNDFQEPPM